MREDNEDHEAAESEAQRIADIEELVVEVSTEIAYKYMQAHLNMSDEELTEWLLEEENIQETEKPNT